MKWFNLCGALLAAMSLTSLADAGLLGRMRGCGAEKGCGCASTCQPACCKPVIVKPCCPNVYTYQRKCSDIKPPCCDTCCPPASCCAPAAKACAPAACAPACAAPAACAPACAAPAACAPKCAPAACAPACAAPAAACAPAAAPACAAPAACGPKCAPACAAPAAACAPTACTTPACAPVCKTRKGLLSGLLAKHNSAKNCGSCNTCAAPAATCAAPCQVRCCNADPCEIAQLIYESQTACYAKDRRKAIHKLGDKFDCICNPEIMTAFIVALNDCDERVREKAADEIGDQIRKHCCCCPEVVAALTCALGDCDKGVRKQAEQALELCGYEVVDGCCNTCAPTACNAGCAPAAAAPAPSTGAAPAPVPPQENAGRKSNLGQLLGLLD